MMRRTDRSCLPRFAAIRRISVALALSLVSVRGYSAANAVPEVGGPFAGPQIVDVSSVYWNPGATGFLRGTHLYGDFGLLLLNASYQRDGTDPLNGDRPYAKAQVKQLNPPLIFGLTHQPFRIPLTIGAAVYPLFGALGQWDAKVEAPPGQPSAFYQPQRSALLSVDWLHVYGTISAAYQVNEVLSIGVGASPILSWYRVEKAADALLDIGIDVDQFLTGDLEAGDPLRTGIAHGDFRGLSFAVSAGILLRPTPDLSIGLSYISPAKADMTGTLDVDFLDPGLLQRINSTDTRSLDLAGNSRVQFNLPQQVHLGFDLDLSPRFTLDGGASWTDWSVQDAFRMINELDGEGSGPVRNPLVLRRALVDSYQFRGGLTVHMTEQVDLRSGLLVETAAVPDEYLSAGNLDSNLIAPSIGARLFRNQWTLTGSFGLYIFQGRTITNSIYSYDQPFLSGLTGDSANGAYRLSAARMDLSFAYRF